MIMFSGIGVTAGTHRLWAHRSYKAKTPLKILLMIMQTSALQNDVIDWCRDHRVHHKYSETDADPHNANRGFFFAHIGWLMAKKHPLVIKRGKETDLSDLEADPILWFQHKYYWYGAIFMALIVPFCIGYFLVGESFEVSFFCFVVSRLMFLTHGTSLVNSAAHMIGNRPYDVTINPCENRFVSTLAFGEG
jgi:stearoyl-CoA desaturase (delta-9 desaturase)